MCGACGKNCPVNAISKDKGKNHMICSEFLDKTAEKCKPSAISCSFVLDDPAATS
ncbi:MAG: hypothetical protein ACYCVD_12095 [Desulfitobacteriaceae bacterium]